MPSWLKNPKRDMELIPKPYNSLVKSINAPKQQSDTFVAYTLAIHNAFGLFGIEYTTDDDFYIKCAYISCKSLINDYNKMQFITHQLHAVYKQAERMASVIERNIDIKQPYIDYGIAFLDGLELSVDARIKEETENEL